MDWAKHNLEFENGLLTIPAWKKYPWLIAAYTTRQSGNLSYHYGDDQEVLNARSRVSAQLGLTVDEWVMMQQVHGNRIQTVTAADAGKGALRFESGIPDTDGLLTNQSGILLGVLVADCIPLLIIDPIQKQVVAIHAGRKGTELGVTSAGIAAMVAAGSKASDLEAVIGPSIGPAHYEVDLWAVNEQQLHAAGVQTIIRTDVDTAEHTDLFFSHRADPGNEGRFAGFIGLRV
jgi:copper oxidase (laccase) domain-containing protein